MNFKVYLDSGDSRVKNYVDKTIQKMNAHQSEFRLIDMQGSIENQQICECIQSIINGNKIFYSELIFNQLNITEKHIILTDKPFFDNYFSHTTYNYQFITVSDWDRIYAPPRMDKFIQYEIIQFLAICAADLSDSQIKRIYRDHAETTDCIFDFCNQKTDIKTSIRTGRICPTCERLLFEFGVTEKQYQSISVLLKLMIGKSSFDSVFIIHGHGEYKNTVARFVESIGITPIILSEQPDGGRTIIEKFEKESSRADFAIALYTPDDIGGVVNTKYEELNPRARQNVVFEHGFFTAKLGRENVVVLLKNGVKKLEIAGDNDGIIYVPFDDSGGWKEQIRQALSRSGYKVNREMSGIR